MLGHLVGVSRFPVGRAKGHFASADDPVAVSISLFLIPVLSLATARSRLVRWLAAALNSFFTFAMARAHPAIPLWASTNCRQLVHSCRFRQMYPSPRTHRLTILGSTWDDDASIRTRNSSSFLRTLMSYIQVIRFAISFPAVLAPPISRNSSYTDSRYS